MPEPKTFWLLSNLQDSQTCHVTALPNTDGRRQSQRCKSPAIEVGFEPDKGNIYEQVQNETSERNATLLTCLINTIRRGSGLAGRFDGDVVVTGNLFKGGSWSKIGSTGRPANK